MTVISEKTRTDYNLFGGVTEFPTQFYFLEDEHLRVIRVVGLVEETLVLGVDYTVQGAGEASGGAVVFSLAPTIGALIILRNVPSTQLTDYVENDKFPADSHERALDKLTMGVQQVRESSGRALLVSPSTPPTVSTVIPPPEPLRFIRWNALANAFENVDSTVDFVNALFTETMTLANGQTLVQFTHPVEKAGFTVNGPNTDNGRLLAQLDYTVNAQTKQVTLTQSYPADTQLTMTYIGSVAAGGGFNIDDRIKLDYLTVTRPFNADTDQDNQSLSAFKLQSTNYMVGNPASPDLNLQTDHISVSTPIRMETEQVLPVDLHEPLASLELATIGTVVKAMDARVFYFDKTVDMLNIPSSWTEIVQLRELVSSGTYMLGFSVLWEYNRANASADLRYSADGGTTWTELHMEPKDSTDITTTSYQFPMTLVDGTHGLTIQMKKESLGGVLNVKFADTWLERKGEY